MEIQLHKLKKIGPVNSFKKDGMLNRQQKINNDAFVKSRHPGENSVQYPLEGYRGPEST